MLERLKYRLSEHLNKGIGAQILLLTVLTVGLICFLALVVFALQPVSFFESIWEVSVGMGFGLVGVKLISTDDYRIVLNPHKECALELTELDELIVIASL